MKSACLVACLVLAVPVLSSAPQSAVRVGIDVFLADVPAAIRGKRVGLITNQSAIDQAGVPDIDRIAEHKDLKLVALFAPEHGIRGTAAAGAKIDNEVDTKTGVPVHSLYGAENQGPTDAMLKDVDVLVYDLREVGGRTWTYVSTMALSMKSAARKNIPFVVLDRPNPIGGEIVEGALLDPKFASFVGMYPIPARHGMTVGELATLFNQKFGINCDLLVVKATGWRRSQWFDQTGQPWANPSPNLRSLAALNSYPGSVYFEGTNLAEGRGTDRPFEQIGAPWLNAPAVARAMNEMRLPGIRFDPITMPVESTAGKFPGQTIPAIRFAITDRQAYRPVRTMLLLIDEIRRQHPRDFAWRASIDRLSGSDKVRLAIDAGKLRPLLDEWDAEAAAFAESRKPFLLYPDERAAAAAGAAGGDAFMYVGTYTEGTSKGIYGYRFAASTGALTPLGLVAESPNVAFLAATPDGRFVYGVNWNSCAACGSRPPPNAPPPTVSAFAVDGKTGSLRFLNKVDPKGDMPTNLVVDHAGHTVLSVQYDGGNVVAFPIRPDGSLGDASYNDKHQGVGVHTVPGPHAHGVLVSPDNQFAFVADLGLDRIYSYRLDAAKAILTPLEPAYIQHAPNTGPRHLAIHPNGKWLYANKEQVPEVTAYEVTNGALKEIQTVSPVPADYTGRSTTAEIQIDQAGKFVYVSNRGHNSIAVFSVDQRTGMLTPIQWVSTDSTPRSFSLDLSGAWLFVANQGGDNVAPYRVDASTGKLTQTGAKLSISTPVTVLFVAAPSY